MTIKLKTEKREVVGRKVKTLRKAGKIPANIFGKNIKSETIVVDAKEFREVFKTAGETQLIDLGGRSVLVSKVQVHPVSGDMLHIDFRQVDLKEKIEAKIPVELIGESPAEKQNLGTVVQQLDEIEVEALPTDLPENIVVDQSILAEVDQAIYVKDIKLDSKVTVITDGESIVAKVEPPQKEEVVEAPVPVEGETPAEGEAPKEGETPAEGEAPKEAVKE
ncbi:MAG: 50S ribosomal protein L25 [bacterium]|nr:MAG: 50S ribosomal protein L25 [bacterium]